MPICIFRPLAKRKKNLLREGFQENTIFVTGNTAIDALRLTLSDSYVFQESMLNSIDFHRRRVITVTAHRRENLGAPLEDICKSCADIVSQYDDVEIVFPVHLNPEVRQTAASVLGSLPRVHLLPPLSIRDMHNLLNRSYMVNDRFGRATRRGALHAGKPVLVLRNVTERPEGVEAGTLKLVGSRRETIVVAAQELLESEHAYNKMARAVNPFGDGRASDRIVQAIIDYFQGIPV